MDKDTGLIYMWNRWQDPETGRFVSEDPERDGNNWYAYAGNSPLVNWDPTGLYSMHGADGKTYNISNNYTTYTANESVTMGNAEGRIGSSGFTFGLGMATATFSDRTGIVDPIVNT